MIALHGFKSTSERIRVIRENPLNPCLIYGFSRILSGVNCVLCFYLASTERYGLNADFGGFTRISRIRSCVH
ncbi:MAG: hypothetical protein FWG87_04630 [Defluviitaleaceae bacterium]|nr:hypothetical protein [Defluviitaleaceae bacterium]